MAEEKKERKWWEKAEEPKTIWQPCKTKEGYDYYYNSQTGETSWEKPAELMSPEELDGAGEWWWIPDEKKAFVPGRIKPKDKTGKFANATLEDGSERKVETAKLEALKKSSLQRIVEDLVLLDSMSPPLILNNLKVRYEKNQIYTNVGTILISVNPYQILPFYTKQVQEDYINRGVREMPPHVYNIAHDAYYGLKEFGQNQSIIISGESGAGKTEATKQCLSYLAAIAGSVGGVEKKILDANPILEAFGNAKTLRNDNSSRFGKFIQVFFSDKNEISASTTENYLLEKIRVVHQADDERNFHIFYQLTKAATAEERKKYSIGKPEEYLYIKTCTEVPTVNDPKDFADVKKSLKTLAFGDDEAESMFATVAAVVTLGNIAFSEKKGDKGMVTDIPDKKWVTNAANLLKVDVARLIRSLTVRELRIKGQATTDVILNPKEAGDIRDALSKFVYGNMFDWIVRRINKAMIQPTSSKQKYIGILDIFGFEIFKHNSFEQLCINFTNEMLQQHFNQQTFKLEESVYQREKIKFKHVEFIDNQPMLDLITKKPDGVLPLLDEELVVPKGTDKTFVQKMHDKQGKNAVYKKFIKDPNFFIIKHYAGEVVYDTFGFLEKNRDSLTTDLLEMLVTSKSPFINVLFPEKELASQDKKASLSKQFQQQLQDLMGALNKTEPHYIRCVKPNPNKSPNEFNSVMSFEQLTYSGVFEAVSIRKQGFPFRLTHEIFAERYDCINKNGGSGPKDKCQAIVKSMAFKADNIQMGATMMLYRAEEHRALELNRNIKLMTIEINDNLERLCKTDSSKLGKDEKEDYFNKLARQVRQADEFRLKTPAAEKARQLLESFVEARMDPETKRKLEVAVKEMDQSLLETALAICDGEGYRTKLTRAARELLGKVLDAEGALAMASRELEIEYLNKALSMCDEFKYNRPSVQAARQLLTNINEANRKCAAAMATKDHEELESALQFCDSFGYAKPNVDDARTLYRQVMDARSGLESAKAAVEQTQLEGAIAACDAFGYNSDLVEECRALCARVTRINVETDAAVKTVDEDHVKAVVKAADEINQTSEWIEYFRTLVRGKYEAFLDAQYKKAFENKTHERAIRLDIKRKDLFIQANGANFSIEKYKLLRDSKEWAAAKFLGLGGSIGNLEERAGTFLRWQKDVIHTPLIEYKDKVPGKEGIKLLKKRALTMFENIQKYMGQRAEKKIGEKMAASIADMVAQKELRSECYIWLIKQMNQNMQPETNTKAWELFAIFLAVFPPSADFENFLEYYFRQNASNAEKWKLKSLLRRRCYEQDSKTVVPSPGEVEGVSSYMSSRLRGFTDPVVSNPSYADLLQPYSGGGGGGGGGDWKKEKDPSSGNFYYVNAKTGASQWDKPAGYSEPGSRPSAKKPIGITPKPAVVAQPKPSAVVAPKPAVVAQPKPAVVKPASPTPAPAASKWQKEKDPSSGEYYYINTETQTSQWDKPADYVDDAPASPTPTPTPTPVVQPKTTTPQSSVSSGAGRGVGGRGVGGIGAGLQITPQMLGGRGRGSPAVAAAPAPAKKSPWKAIKDESSGEFYYYNEETNESSWDKPPGL